MKFKVGIGESDFENLRKLEKYYVDKTEIIYELMAENENKVTLFTRPRRFGKTLMMSMMENFFNKDKDSRGIFAGLKIMEHEELCEKWMNQYPVLFLSFKDIEGLDFSGAYKMLKTRIADVCKGLEDLMLQTGINSADMEIFQKLMYKSADEDEVKNSLKIMMRMMHAAYGKKVILLLDEYDVPIAKASERNTDENHYYDSMLDVIRGIMSTALKDNEFLEFAIITGCLRIAKESIFTGTNNFASYSVLDDEFSEYFGFTEEEVKDMLFIAEREESADVIKEWYDGYIFGNSYLYCPWDVINYVSALRKRENARPKNYWKNTSHNEILLSFVKRTDFNVARKFEILMNGGSVTQTISDALTYDTLHASENNLWSVLLMTGYLTKADPEEEGETVSLRIPNKEISSIFYDTVAIWFEETTDPEEIRSLMEVLWEGKEEEASKQISDLLWNTISYNDYHEDYYHAFLTGVFVGRGYEVESNKERGLGRPDIQLLDHSNRRAIIIEAKKSKKESDMERDCDEALEQIRERKYAEGLYGYTKILCYGVAFFQKQAKVKLER